MEWKLDKSGHKLVRYADDFLVFCESEAKLRSAIDIVNEIMGKLKLRLSAEKTNIVNAAKSEVITFLGTEIQRVNGRYVVRRRGKAIDKFKADITGILNKQQKPIERLRKLISGNVGYWTQIINAAKMHDSRGTKTVFDTSELIRQAAEMDIYINEQICKYGLESDQSRVICMEQELRESISIEVAASS